MVNTLTLINLQKELVVKPKNHTEAKEKYLGKTFQSNNHGCFKVVGYTSSTKVDVVFLETGFKTTTHVSLIIRGEVKDCFKPTVQGFGIIGCENIRDEDGGILEAYRKWESMLDRVHGRSCKQDVANPYYDTSVSEDFRWFGDFKNWCEKQVGFGNENWALDKDILVKGNKVYSPETCCFVPVELNSLLVNNRATRGEFPVGVYYDVSRSKFQSHIRMHGKRKHLGRFVTPEEAFQAYKQAKEAYIKEVVELYKDQIDIRVYEALMKYEVDIND